MSFLIAVFCVGLIASVDVFSGLLIGEMNTNGSAVGTMAINSLTGMYNDGRDIYASLGDAYYKIAKIASYSYTVGLNLGFISTSTSRSPASGLSTLAAEVGGAMDSVSNYMLALAAQQALIIFFINSAQILLPVGIFMRSFSLTRKAGAGVLAAVISTSVIYPASFVISEAVHQTYRGNMLSGLSNLSLIPDPGNPPLSSIACSPWMQWVVESPLGMVVGLVAGGVSNIPGMGEFTATFISSIGMALFGGENGWFLTVCPIACTVTCAPTVAGFAACFSLCMTRCYEVFQVVYPITVSGFALITWPMLGGYAPDLNTAQDVAVYYAPLRDSALPAVAKYSVLSIVFTLIPAIITIVLMRNLAMLFGGEPQFYGLSKLV